MKKKCELCGGVARMYCESDQASLCWDCDEKVHGANFLVAKHTRCLLCSSCQSPTPWKASGPRLGHTISACDSCVSLHNAQDLSETNGHDFDEDRFDDGDGVAESYDDGEEDDEEYDDDDEDEEDDEEAENQVVPWAAAAAALQPPVVSSSSSVSSGGGGGFPAKRNSDLLYSDDEIGCSSSHHASNSYRPSKRSSTLIHDGGRGGGGETATGSTAIINSIMRFHRDKSSDGEDIVFTISNMNRDHSR